MLCSFYTSALTALLDEYSLVRESFPVSLRLYEREVSLPLYTKMTNAMKKLLTQQKQYLTNNNSKASNWTKLIKKFATIGYQKCEYKYKVSSVRGGQEMWNHFI